MTRSATKNIEYLNFKYFRQCFMCRCPQTLHIIFHLNSLKMLIWSAIALFLPSLNTFFTADVNEDMRYQELCMKLSVRFDDIVNTQNGCRTRMLVVRRRDIDTVCRWIGVVCEINEAGNRVVREIQWGSMNERFVDSLQWFPHTVKEISIANQEVRGGFHAKMLPKELRSLHLSRVRSTFRNISVDGLPERLERFVMQWCNVQGYMEIHQINRSLKFIDFRGNPIDLVVIGYLPETLEDILFYSPSARIQFVSAYGDKIDLRVKPHEMWAKYK